MKTKVLSALLCLCAAGCAHAWDVQEVDPFEIENSVMMSVTEMERSKCAKSDMPLLCEMEFDAAANFFRIAERALFIGAIVHDDSPQQKRLFAISRSAHEAGIRRMDEIHATYIKRSQAADVQAGQ